MKKALVAATIIGFIAEFEINDISILQNLGYEVHYAANCEIYSNVKAVQTLDFMGVVGHNIPFARNPFDKNNVSAYKMLRKIINEENFEIIHCHTPVGGVITRLAAKRLRKKGTKVIYTAHGFHFYNGAPLKNWLLYYPAEKLCSYWTDVLITINKEDHALAKKKMKAKKIYYVPGVGIDLHKFSNISVNKEEKRKELGVPDNAVLLISAGELNENKNHEIVIRAFNEFKAKDKDIYYIIAGSGNKKEFLENLIKSFNLEKNIKLLGYRTDMPQLYAVSDIFVFPSLREGLSVALMEAMASGLAVVCSRIRGNTDLTDEDKGGVLFDPKSIEDISNALNMMLKSDIVDMGNYNMKKVKEFDIDIVKCKMTDIYNDLNK